MKILHLSTYEKAGGAAIAANRLHLALNTHTKHDSIMGVLHKQSDSDIVFPLQMYTSRVARVLGNRISNQLAKRMQASNEVYFSSYLLPNSLVPAIGALKPDIIHLHWIADFISPWVLKKLAMLNIPVVWTLHDTWAFTGGCHYYGLCEKWKDHCESCSIVNDFCGFDVVKFQWHEKQKAYNVLQPTVVGLSKRFKQDIECSGLLKNVLSLHLPNTLNTTIFHPLNKSVAREILGLEQNKKYILFGADSATHDPRKGYDLLVTALAQLPQQVRNSMHCLVFGTTKGQELPISATFLGRLHDATTLALMYSAADVFVCPSREDNLPNTIMESLACGTPVVGFNIGGIPDMVQHKQNGYVVEPYDTQGLANGITYVLEDTDRHSAMCSLARQEIEERYAPEIVAKQYMELYGKVLSKHKI